MKLHRDLATLFSVALMIGSTLVASASPAAAAAPTNDNFASADALPSTASGSVTGSNLDATRETLEPGGMTTTVWWSWTAPESGTYLFDTCGTAFESMPAVYTGAALPSLTEVFTYVGKCFFRSSSFLNYEVTVTATAGTTYYVQVGGFQGGMGNIVLRWWPAEVPTNDDIANATELAGSNGSISGTTRFATAADGEAFSGSPSVWFTWTPPAVGRYVFDTCGSNFDTVLEADVGTTDALTYVTDNDDSCMTQSAITIDAATVEPYYIAVAGFDSFGFGDVVLHWRAEAAPANDDWANATPIGNESGTAFGDATFATSEEGEPIAGYSSTWWRWTAPHDGLVVFDTCGSNFGGDQLGVYTGTHLTSLTEAAWSEPGCFGRSMVLFEATSGTDYSILVTNISDHASADVVLHWQMGVPPANDDFASAATLSGAGGTEQMNTLFATQEPGETVVANRSHTVWWTWLAPADDWVVFDTCGSSVDDHVIGVYVGDSVDALAEWGSGVNNACGGTGASARFHTVAGQQYYIGVGSDGMGDIVLHWPATGVVGAPTITTHPQATTVTAGSTAQFTAAATGLPVPTVRWQVLPTDSGTDWTDVPDAVSATLNVPTTYAMNGYQYRAVFTNSEGSTLSDPATLTVNAFAPIVTTHPHDSTVAAGSPVSFTATASGDPAPTVQWQISTDDGVHWTDVADATSTTLSFSTTNADNGNQYRAVFTNIGGTATSSAAVLTVTPDVSVTGLTATVSRGQITVTFTGTGDPAPTSFQCEFGGKGAKGGWVPCSSGDVFKTSAKTVTVRAGYDADGPWGLAMSTPIGRAPK